MSSYVNRVWCNVLNIDDAHILLGRPWLYDLNVTSLGRSNTYEFKFKRKKIVLKSTKLKSNVKNNKDKTITDKNKTPCYLVTISHFSPGSPIDGSTLRSRNSLSLLSLLLGIPLNVTVEPLAPHLHELHDHNTKQTTISNYNYQSAIESQKQLQELVIGDNVLIRVHPEMF